MKNIIEKLNIILSSKDKLRLTYLSTLSIFASLADVLSIGLLIPLLGSIINNDNLIYIDFVNKFFNDINTENFLEFILFIFILLVVLKNLFQIFFNYTSTKFLINVNQSIQRKLYLNYINKEYWKLANIHTSDIFKDIDYESSVFTNGLLNSVLVISANLILFISFTTFLFLYNFKITLIINMTALVLIYIFKFFLFKKIKKWGYERQTLQKNYTKTLKETFDVIREIKLLKIHKYFIKIFKENLMGLKSNGIKKSFVASLTRPIIEVTFLLLFVIIVIIEIENPENLIINLGIYSAIAFRLMPSINIMLSSYQKIKSSVSSLSRIEEATVIYNNFNQATPENKEINFKKDIKLKDISIKHFENDEFILQNINLNIDCGMKIGIMGTSGSGKTTLLNNIIGFMKPDLGQILIDNVPLKNNLIESWQKLISYVPQNVVLFDKSLLENITLSFNKNLNSSETERFNKAISFAQLKSLREKLDKTGQFVGEMGSKISRGEAQRIGIARAIYMNCKILILDESTNFLDEKTEKNFLDIVKNQMDGITVLFVSHKRESLQICDNIYRINNKKIEKIK